MTCRIIFSDRQTARHAFSSAIKGVVMDFTEKAKVRIEHWLKHNKSHLKEYDAFSKELKNYGKHNSARYIREMANLISESSDYLYKALEALE